MTELLWFLWPVIGWTLGLIATPTWMWKDGDFGDRVAGVLVLLICGGIAGPFGIFWLFGEESRFYDKS